jgi:hypothetical protein
MTTQQQGPLPSKKAMAEEALKTLGPDASTEDVANWVKQKYNTEVVNQTIYNAKKSLGDGNGQQGREQGGSPQAASTNGRGNISQAIIHGRSLLQDCGGDPTEAHRVIDGLTGSIDQGMQAAAGNNQGGGGRRRGRKPKNQG